MWPVFLAYVLSYVYVGVYWSNHHHLLHGIHHVTGSILWADLHLLLWLSLVPFVTGWMSENHFGALPTALYGFVLAMAGVAYYILSQRLVATHGKSSRLGRAIGRDVKAVASTVIYLVAIPLAFVHWTIAFGLYMLVVAFWLVPDRRIEKPSVDDSAAHPAGD